MSLTETARMTEVEAVNRVLRATGRSPVIDSLSDPLSLPVKQAIEVIYENSREIQLNGWSFNIERKYILEGSTLPGPGDVGNVYEYNLPTNTLRVYLTSYTSDWDLIEQEGKLYDRKNHTFNFSDILQDIEVDIVFFRPWDNLPEYAKVFIVSKAARRYQQQILGDKKKDTFLKEQETRAEEFFLRAETNTQGYNIFNNPRAVPGAYRNWSYRTPNFIGGSF